MSEQVVVSPQEQSEGSSVEQAIREALELSDDEFADWKETFIEDRLTELEAGAEPKEYSGFSPPVGEFFHPESEIKPLVLGRGFRLDDKQVYHSFLDTLRDFSGQEYWQDPAKYNQLVFYAVQYGIQRYFGNVVPSSEDQAKREARLWGSGVISSDDEVPEPQPRSISENKSEALCSERAAAAHNLLLLAGKENYYYVGKLATGDREHDLHAFVIFRNSKGRHIIYDPMNPEFIENSEGEVVSVKPSAYEGGDDLLAGQGVDAQHGRHLLEDGNVRELRTKTYYYIANPFHHVAA